jgi:hypothetical protein
MAKMLKILRIASENITKAMLIGVFAISKTRISNDIYSFYSLFRIMKCRQAKLT